MAWVRLLGTRLGLRAGLGERPVLLRGPRPAELCGEEREPRARLSGPTAWHPHHTARQREFMLQMD